MGTSDVLKVLKIARAVGTIFYLLYSRFFYNLVFKFGASRCFHGNFSVLHSITSFALYNLFMHYFIIDQSETQQLTWCSIHLHRHDMLTVPLTVLLKYPIITNMTCTLSY